MVGVVLLVIGILSGHDLMKQDVLGWAFDWNRNTVAIAIAVYGFIASVLPVWFLLVPRDYLSTYLKIGTILMLTLGIIFVRPTLLMPTITPFINGGGPVIGGPCAALHLHHHCLRGRFRLPRHHRYGHHTQDDRQ